MSAQKLAARRAELVQRIAQQRNDIAILTHSLERPMSFFDKGYALVQKFKQQPKLVLAGALLFATAFRKPAFRISATLLAIAEWFILKKR